jgi:hypothetical protein
MASRLLPPLLPLGVLAALALFGACSRPASTEWQTQDRIQAIDGQTWVVGTHLVTVSPEAAAGGEPSVGSIVRLSGRRTDAGELLADHVEVVSRAEPTPRPATTPTLRPPAPTLQPTTRPAVRPAAPAAPARPSPRRREHEEGEDDD